MITLSRINGFFNQLTELPNQNALSPAGCEVLAEWGERQPWWDSFAVHHRLGGDWRSTPMGDSYLFVLNLYRFLNSPASPTGMVSTVPSGSEGLEISLPRHKGCHDRSDRIVLAQP
jgi:hypothetical protein